MKRRQPHIGVGVVVLNGEDVLLIRRAKPPRKGGWSLPGGHQEWGETVEECALREVEEETGLQVKLTGLLDVIDSIRTNDQGETDWHYTLIDFAAISDHRHAVAASDASEARWFSLKELEALELWPETIRIVKMALDRQCR